MAKEWILSEEGRNLKFKREALLNYGMNRWALNKAHSVGPTSELIRNCSPNTYDEWKAYYFKNAEQKKKNGLKITPDYLTELGEKLYIKLSEVVQSELDSIQEDECIEYVYNLVINRTYEGYRTEVDTIYGQLQDILGYKIEPAPDKWDRTYNVDFFININNKYVGIQIKPISSGKALNQHQWDRMHEDKHNRFTQKFNGQVFFIYSVKNGKKKSIHNPEVIEDIKKEIIRLQSL